MSPKGMMQARNVELTAGSQGIKRPLPMSGKGAAAWAGIQNKQPRLQGKGASFNSQGMALQSPSRPQGAAGTGQGTGKFMTGSVKSYNPFKGFGFISSPGVTGDVYFMRLELPDEVRDIRESDQIDLNGRSCSFELALAPDGKFRAKGVVLT